ncbi:unnamed protein product [Caenorhabditis angaria]|uniref:Uncharacterized protein n=1 Tax=Caenorhabditis angaria TaxID=860376 RepID=A0A9P1IVC2_9PELO|nr:unnamed protein product [Caenorhabditis angaria]
MTQLELMQYNTIHLFIEHMNDCGKKSQETQHKQKIYLRNLLLLPDGKIGRAERFTAKLHANYDNYKSV